MMKSQLQIQKSELLDMISTVIGAVDKKSVHPALCFAKVLLTQTEISMIALDLEIQVSTTKKLSHPNLTQTQLCFCLPVKKVYDFIRALPEDELLTLEFDEQHQKITVQAARCRLEAAAFDPNNFPVFENIEHSSVFYVDAQELKQSIDSVSFSMANSDIRYYLNGMLWRLEGDQLACVATDGHRMALNTLKLQLDNAQKDDKIASMILPRRAIFELNKLLGSKQTRVKVSFTQALLSIHIDGMTFTSKLIEGKFPDYARVLPKEVGEQLPLAKEQLKNALIQVQPVITQKNKGVEFKFLENNVRIFARNSQGEEVTVEVQLDKPRQKGATPLSLGLNLGYIYDYLQTVKDETVTFFVKSSKSGILLSHNQETKYLVMPLTL